MAAVSEFLLAVAQAVLTLMLWLVRWCPELALAEVDGEVRQIPRSDKPSCASSYAPECLASPCYIFCRLPTLLYFLPLRSCEKTPTLDLWAYPFRKVSGTVSLRMFIRSQIAAHSHLVHAGQRTCQTKVWCSLADFYSPNDPEPGKNSDFIALGTTSGFCFFYEYHFLKLQCTANEKCNQEKEPGKYVQNSNSCRFMQRKCQT